MFSGGTLARRIKKSSMYEAGISTYQMRNEVQAEHCLWGSHKYSCVGEANATASGWALLMIVTELVWAFSQVCEQ